MSPNGHGVGAAVMRRDAQNSTTGVPAKLPVSVTRWLPARHGGLRDVVLLRSRPAPVEVACAALGWSG